MNTDAKKIDLVGEELTLDAPSGWTWRFLVAAVLYTAVLPIIFGLLTLFASATLGALLVPVALLWPVGMLFLIGGFLCVDYFVRQQLRFDPQSKRITRKWVVKNKERGVENPVWLAADKVIAIHHHRADFLNQPWEAVYLDLGKRRILVFEQFPRLVALNEVFKRRPAELSPLQVRKLLERLTEYTGVSVSVVNGFFPPKKS